MQASIQQMKYRYIRQFINNLTLHTYTKRLEIKLLCEIKLLYIANLTT